MLILLNLLQVFHKLKRCKTHILFLLLIAAILYTFTEYYPYEKDIKHAEQSSNSLQVEFEDEILAYKQDYAHFKNEFYIASFEVKEVEQPKPKKKVVRVIHAEVTAYTAGYESTGKNPGDKGYGITASGRKVERYVTAACPPSIPLGTWIEIEGIGKRRCDDRGSAIKGKVFDVYFKHLDTALEFGRQHLVVKILKESEES